MKRTVGFVQFAPRFGDSAGNIARIREMIGDVSFDLLVLPELCTTGYQFADKEELSAHAEPVNGPSCETLADISRERGGVVVAGFAEKSREGVYNSALTVTPAGTRFLYRKVHLFDREKDLFLPGNTPFEPIDVGWDVPIGVMICFDWIFPEAMRSLALGGARLIAHPANLVMPYCQRAMFARSLENGVFVVTANRHGIEERAGQPPLHFTGASQVMGPDGAVRLSATEYETGVRMVEIETNDAGFQLNSRNNLARDRRPGMYRL